MGSSFRHSVFVTSYAAGTLVDGVYTEGTPTISSVMVSVQPANARDLQCLPEGRRTIKTYRLYSDTSLNSLQTTKNPDRVTLTDGEYEVVTKDPWKNGVIEHYKYLVVKV